MLRSLLLAPPGAGKGTQGERLADAFGVPHLATGDMLRQQVAEGTPIGLEVQSLMDRGELVPDQLVVDLAIGRIAGPPPVEGFVLDGFPRTIAQAEAAYKWGRGRNRTFHAVISLRVPEEELVRRLLGRGHREGRTDDNEATILHRLEVYAANAKPLIDFYEGRDILVEIDGTGSVDDVAGRIHTAIEALDLTT